LRSNRTHSAKLVMFDELQGKVIAHSRAYDALLRAPQGALLRYHYSSWRDMMFLDWVELEKFPQLSIQFIHQVLEILDAFMPLSAPLPELFEKIFLLYTDQANVISATVVRQQVFLCQILASLGIYPDETTYLRNHGVRCLILSPFEFMVDHEDTRMHEVLAVWLRECLATHPTVSSWKTLK
jgi:hypothetical protein